MMEYLVNGMFGVQVFLAIIVVLLFLYPFVKYLIVKPIIRKMKGIKIYTIVVDLCEKSITAEAYDDRKVSADKRRVEIRLKEYTKYQYGNNLMVLESIPEDKLDEVLKRELKGIDYTLVKHY